MLVNEDPVAFLEGQARSNQGRRLADGRQRRQQQGAQIVAVFAYPLNQLDGARGCVGSQQFNPNLGTMLFDLPDPADRGDAPGQLLAFPDPDNLSGLDIDGNLALPLQAIATGADIDQRHLMVLVNGFFLALRLVCLATDAGVIDRRQISSLKSTTLRATVDTRRPNVFLFHAADKEILRGVIGAVAGADQLLLEVHAIGAEVVGGAQANADKQLAVGGNPLEVTLGQNPQGLAQVADQPVRQAHGHGQNVIRRQLGVFQLAQIIGDSLHQIRGVQSTKVRSDRSVIQATVDWRNIPLGVNDKEIIFVAGSADFHIPGPVLETVVNHRNIILPALVGLAAAQ